MYDNIAQRYRTTDVQSDAGSFNDLLLPQPLVSALAAAGFQRPSPVQTATIPIGRVGSDVIVQAKSGTGKTAVFATILLEKASLDISTPQALVLAPTRELAIQNYQVIERIANGLPDPCPAAAVFVGGLPTAEDEKRLRRTCHIVVGTPGRISALITSGALLLGRLKCVVLDEADSLLGEGFYADTAWIMQQLPSGKQVLAFSATYTQELLQDLEPLMKRPQKVLLCEETLSLQGIRQFYKLISSSSSSNADTTAAATTPDASVTESELQTAAAGDGDSSSNKQQQQPLDVQSQQALLLLKVEALLQLLSTVSFHQAVVFCNKKPAADWLARRLTSAGCPATYLSADLPQPERMAAMEAVRGFRVRIIVSTDVMARGVDFDRVNLVVNLDLPHDAATYVHRVGRTGRFGSRGVAVALVTQQELTKLLSYLADVRFGDITELPEVIPDDFYTFALESDWERQALQQLLHAPVSTPPASPPPLHKQKKKDATAYQPQEWQEDFEDGQIDTEQQQQQLLCGESNDLQQQQQQQQEYASDADAAAAWDAWAEYYRSQGYSYPYTNPYRQQQRDDASSRGGKHAQQQQQQQWAGDENHHHQTRPYSQQQDHWQPYRSSRPVAGYDPSRYASSSWKPWMQLAASHGPISSGWQQQQQQQQQWLQERPMPFAEGVTAAAYHSSECEVADEDAGEQLHGEDEVEGEDESECELPTSEEECDPRAMMLLSRLQVTEAAAASAAAYKMQSVNTARNGAAATHAGSHTDEQLGEQESAAVRQEKKRQHQRAVHSCCAAHGPDRHHAVDGFVCMSCWYAAYAAWQKDYESWRQQYCAWWHSMHP